VAGGDGIGRFGRETHSRPAQSGGRSGVTDERRTRPDRPSTGLALGDGVGVLGFGRGRESRPVVVRESGYASGVPSATAAVAASTASAAR